jgi:hypothetical protein
LKLKLTLKHPNIGIKTIGVVLTIIGLVFLSDPTSLNLKIGFASILIGILIVFVISIKIIPEKIINKQIKGSIEAVLKIIKELNLKGNAIIIPKTENLTEERIIIPPKNRKKLKIPNINNENVFLRGTNNKNLGIALPPSGLQLLDEIEKEEKIKINKIEDIEKKLQMFVGMDLIKSLSFKQNHYSWELILEKPIFCTKNPNLCKQYPCPTCSAILVAIIRAMNNPELRLQIKGIKQNGRKITFYLNFIKRKQNRVDQN